MDQVTEIKSKAFSGAIWKFLERISAQVVSMVVTVILARLLEPGDYSTVSIVSVFFTFANVFISSGFNVALIQKKEADLEAYSSALFLSLGIAITMYAALFIGAPSIAALYNQALLVPVIRVMGLILPINAVKSIVCAYISANLQFRKFFFATIGGTLASAVVGIAMAYMGFGPWALVAQQMTTALIHTAILCLTTKMPFVFRISLKKVWDLFNYSWKIVVSSVIDVVYKQINPLFIGLRYSGTDLAYYTKGKSFPELLSGVCSNTLSAVLFPVLSKFQSDREELLRGLRRYNKTASFVVFPALLGFFAVSDNFVELVLTEKWMPVAAYIRIFCLSEMVMSIEAGNRETLKALGRSDIFLKYEIIKKCLFFTIIAMVIFWTDSPVLLAYSAIGCAAVVLFTSMFTNAGILNYGIGEQLLDLIPNLLCSILMCLAVRAVSVSALPVGVELIVQILTGACVYVGACLVIRNESLIYVWGRVKPALMGMLRRKM